MDMGSKNGPTCNYFKCDWSIRKQEGSRTSVALAQPLYRMCYYRVSTA